MDKIRQRRAQINRIRAGLDAEDQELAVAEKVLVRLEASPTEQSGNGGDRVSVTTSWKPIISDRRPTQPDLIIATLRSYPEPWLADSAALHEAD